MGVLLLKGDYETSKSWLGYVYRVAVDVIASSYCLSILELWSNSHLLFRHIYNVSIMTLQCVEIISGL